MGRRSSLAAWLPFAAALSLGSTSCLYARIFYYNTPTLAAPTYFEERPVRAGTPSVLPRAEHEASFPLTDEEKKRHTTFDELLAANLTRAFVVVRDDTVIYERYFGDVTPSTRLPGFSVSKTFAALLVGCASEDGLLSSVKTPVVTFIPELAKKDGYGKITLEHLLRMNSGIDFDEESTAGAALYYSKDLRSHLHAYDVKWTPGTHYLYGSINIQLLWEVLHRKLEGRTVADYFESRVWRPLGAEHDASWSLDSADSASEKLFGGFNATARDHARLGLLYLHKGTFAGHTIVSPAWVEESLAPDEIAGEVRTADGWVRRGKYQWFLSADGQSYFAKGYRGQYVFVVPARNMVFVRFGEGYGELDWIALFRRLADATR